MAEPVTPMQALDHADRLLHVLAETAVQPYTLSTQQRDQLERAKRRVTQNVLDAVKSEALALHVLAAATRDLHGRLMLQGLVEEQEKRRAAVGQAQEEE